MFEDVAEGFKVGVPPANDAVSQLEGGDVGLQAGKGFVKGLDREKEKQGRTLQTIS